MNVKSNIVLQTILYPSTHWYISISIINALVATLYFKLLCVYYACSLCFVCITLICFTLFSCSNLSGEFFFLNSWQQLLGYQQLCHKILHLSPHNGWKTMSVSLYHVFWYQIWSLSAVQCKSTWLKCETILL